MKVLISMFLAITLGGCATPILVQRYYSPKRGGVVSYGSSPSRNVTAVYQAEAEKLAREFCGGSIRKIQEATKTGFYGNVSIKGPTENSMHVNDSSDSVFLAFECEK